MIAAALLLFLNSGTDSGVDERFRFELVGLARGEGCKHLRACTAAGIQQTETSAGGLGHAQELALDLEGGW